MLPLKIAWRFLRSAPVQSVLIAGGIAVGIATQIFVGSLITSLQASLVDTTIGSAPHITIQARDEGDPVEYSDRVRDLVERDVRVDGDAIAKIRSLSSLYKDESASAPLVLLGGELAEIDGIFGVSSRLEQGEAVFGSDDILIGAEFAEKYSIGPGDRINLTFPTGGSASLTVTGVFDLGAAAFNERNAFVSAELSRSLLGWRSSEYSAIEAQLIEPFESAAVAAEWRRALTDVEIVEWQAQNGSLLAGLQSQASSSYLIQTFVLVAVALGIGSTLAIAAVQKTRQIGILKAMGLSDRRAGRIFLWQALLLGLGGSTLGVILACVLIALFAFVPVTFTVTLQPWFAVISFAIGVAVALASSVIPTRRTSKLDPIEVIQGG